MDNNYFLGTNKFDTLSLDEFYETEIGDYFEEYMISVSFSIPELYNKSSISQAEFHYYFEFLKINEKEIEVLFHEKNHSTLNLMNYKKGELNYNIIINEHQKFPTEKNFVDFCLDESFSVIDNLFKKINKDFFLKWVKMKLMLS